VRRFLVLVFLAALALAVAAAAPGRQPHRPRVTIIGDSIAGALIENPPSARYLRRSFDLRLDLAICRRLVAPSCVYRGEQPTTGVEAVVARRGHLGETVVIFVGYNDEDAASYRSGIGRVMRALLRAGVKNVVWTTLHESGTFRSVYGRSNAAIRRAAKRWQQVTIADWNARARGRVAWFGSDGLHMNGAGAMALARLFRQSIVAARAT
jgi:hypothetical protein